MTSDPENIREARARAVMMLTRPQRLPESETIIRNRRIWSRATEQARRAMLKDCGWL